MEYLAGGPLDKKLRGGPLPVTEAVRIGGDLCEALAYAHGRGIVHCDIKPGNILFDQSGDVRLADFGIAHVSSELMSRQFFTASGTAMGTVRYMAPEQLEGKSVHVRPTRPASSRGRPAASQEEAVWGRSSPPSAPQRPSGERHPGGLKGWLGELPCLAWLALGLAAAALGVLAIGGTILLGSGAAGSKASATPTQPPTATFRPPSPTVLRTTAPPPSSGPMSTPKDATEAPAVAPTATPRSNLGLMEPRHGQFARPEERVAFRWGVNSTLPEDFTFRVKTDQVGYAVLCEGSEMSCFASLPIGNYEWWVELHSRGEMIDESEHRKLWVR
jgi:serine/threonine protein kinase